MFKDDTPLWVHLPLTEFFSDLKVFACKCNSHVLYVVGIQQREQERNHFSNVNGPDFPGFLVHLHLDVIDLTKEEDDFCRCPRPVLKTEYSLFSI